MKVWSEDTEEALQECFNVTDWQLFQEDRREDIKGLSRCITDYIHFWEDAIVPSRKVRYHGSTRRLKVSSTARRGPLWPRIVRSSGLSKRS